MTQFFRHSCHKFSDLITAPFDVKSYSCFKFGSDNDAKLMGYALADSFFETYNAKLLANDMLIFASPYNHVKNAATIMTEHFMNRLNSLLVNTNGKHVEYSIIHRKVSYINDYGFLSKEKRQELIDNDLFYINTDFLANKLLVFIDDVYITGTHENKLIEVIKNNNITNECGFLYFTQYTGMSPNIEGALNFASITNIHDFIDLTKRLNHHTIVRPLKYLLGQQPGVLKDNIGKFSTDTINKMYFGCLAEGYYCIPSYQENFKILTEEHQTRGI